MVAVNQNEQTVVVARQCSCGAVTEIEMPVSKMLRWRNREECIQNIFPEFPPNKRETLITGLCDKCQEEIFAPMVDEQEE